MSELLKVNLAGVELENPIMPASGTFGYGQEFAKLYDINILGAITLKTTTVEPRLGNPLPRIAECKAGMLNSIGLQNPGIEEVVNKEIPELVKVCEKPIIASIGGSSVEEYAQLAEILDAVDAVTFIEVNISCPNVEGEGSVFGSTVEKIAAATKAVRKATKKPFSVKLSPINIKVVEAAKAVEDAGADAITTLNTFVGMKIDVKTRKPVVARKIAGYSGPAAFPVAVAMIYQCAKAVDIPIIGAGGVQDGEDVLEMIMAGATAVQVGTENLVEPFACRDIINKLPARMERLGIKDLDSIRGCVI